MTLPGHRSRPRIARAVVLVVLIFVFVFGGGLAAGCRSGSAPDGAGPLTLTLGAYTTPREAYAAILPAFRRHWKERTGHDVAIQESYLGSGAQARAILGGFEADVAALSLEPDIETLRQGKLIRHDWKAGPHQGMITRSIVVIGVREGNPRGIRDWDDLARPGIAVLTPNVRTSGGAMWNVAAIHGAALRGQIPGVAAGDAAAATRLLAAILRNVAIMDRSARDAMLTFERGVGDAIITYENEILVGRSKGQRYDYVIPRSTIVIENPVAVIDEYVDQHGNRALAEGFVAFLTTDEAQRVFAEHGLRPVATSSAPAAALGERFPAVADAFTVADLGGWPALERALFAAGASYDRALEQAHAGAGK
jgi:sulfate/thiosulfate-binding protein